MTHIWVGKLTIIGSDNGLPPGRLQAIIWTIAGIFLIDDPIKTFIWVDLNSRRDVDPLMGVH